MSLMHGPKMITDGLIFLADAKNPRSYPGAGNTWYDLTPYGNHGTIHNSPEYSPSGHFTFNYTNQYVDFGNSSLFGLHIKSHK